jgi:hypothetical protein
MPTDSTPDTVPASISRGDLPRLRVHHLFVLVTVAAVLFTGWRLALTPDELTRALSQPWYLGTAVIGLMIIAVGITLAVLSICWRRKGYPALTQPGQWMLLAYLCPTNVWLSAAYWRLLPDVTGNAGGQRPWGKNVFLWELSDLLHAVLLSGLYFFHLLPGIFFGWCAWRVADTWSWRLLFITRAAPALVVVAVLVGLRPLVMPIYQWFVASGEGYAFGHTLLALLALVTIVDDAKSGRPRYWTHWAAAVLLALEGFLHAGSMLLR